MAVPARSEDAQRGRSMKSSVVRRLPPMENRCVLNGRYQIIKLIGHGSWGACYSGKSLYDAEEQIVAVKCIPRHGFADYKLALIDREIRFHKRASDIGHRNILKLIEHGEDKVNNITFIVTELCTKGDLFASLRMHKLSGQHGKIRRKILQIIDGVQAMHENGIYHRDLKPENVFVREDKTIAIGDFGFATDERLSEETRLGTVRYMSPEVLEGLYFHLPSYRPPPSDVWAIGVILINMVTGRSCWEKACLKDNNFLYYVKGREMEMHGLKREADFFSMLFDIPDDVIQLFNDIFTLSPSSRIKLPELRKRVESITSFGSGKVRLQHQPSESGAEYTERYVSAIPSTDTIATVASNSAGILQKQNSIEPNESYKTLDTSVASSARYSETPSSIPSKDIGALLKEDCSGPSDCEVDSKSPIRFADGDKTLHRTSKPAVSAAVVQSQSDLDDFDEDSEGPETPETRATDNVVLIEKDIERLELSAPTHAAETNWAKATEIWSPNAPQTMKQPQKMAFGLVQLDQEVHLI